MGIIDAHNLGLRFSWWTPQPKERSMSDVDKNLEAVPVLAGKTPGDANTEVHHATPAILGFVRKFRLNFVGAVVVSFLVGAGIGSAVTKFNLFSLLLEQF